MSSVLGETRKREFNIQLWKNKIGYIKAKYPYVHLFYDSTEGWAKLSYKGKQRKITHRITHTQIDSLVIFLTS